VGYYGLNSTFLEASKLGKNKKISSIWRISIVRNIANLRVAFYPVNLQYYEQYFAMILSFFP
jgi:hypothetical protein